MGSVDGVINFVIDNYLWLAIGVVFILMLIIGYFAEKTNFGKKPLHEKKVPIEKPSEASSNSNEEAENEVSKPFDLNVPINDKVLANSGVKLPDVNEENTDSISSVNQEEELHDVSGENVPLPDIPTTPEEDLNVPFGDSIDDATTDQGNISVPDVEPESTDDSSSEDDVWKF